MLNKEKASFWEGLPADLINSSQLNWSAEAGSIDVIADDGSSVLYTAPNTSGEYLVTVRLAEDPTVSATATAIVVESDVIGEEGIRFRLSWGAEPSDLDSYLWLPANLACHVYYGNRGSALAFPSATLDNDATSGFGPETITNHESYTTGIYEYAVHIYSGLGDFSTSEAQLEVYTDQGRIATFFPPETGTGTWWHVLSMDGATGEITEVNELLSVYQPYPEEDELAECFAGDSGNPGGAGFSDLRQMQDLKSKER